MSVVSRDRKSCRGDFQRAERIGEFWSYPRRRAFAERLIHCEEDRTLRAVLVGMLRLNWWLWKERVLVVDDPEPQ
jgi:hypothetical protein